MNHDESLNTTENNADELSPKEQYDLKQAQKMKAKQKARTKEKLTSAPRKAGKYILGAVIILGIIGGVGWLLTFVPNLPPTTVEGHSEDSPQAHIVTSPISDRVQRHMLEHSDGAGPPGVIIQYNCTNYECEPDLVDTLTDIAEDYPENVYLAPNAYDAKIVLTKLGQREVLNSFDADKIREFIE